MGKMMICGFAEDCLIECHHKKPHDVIPMCNISCGVSSGKYKCEEVNEANKMIKLIKKNRQRFWMCFVDGCESPKYMHTTESAARTEAVRLAGITGLDVFVLEASSFCRATQAEWNETLT